MGERPTAQNLAIGEQLKKLRLGRGMTLRGVGVAIGASEAKISRIEGGRSRASVQDVTNLLDLYEVHGQLRDYLLDIVGQQVARGTGWWREQPGHADSNVPQYLLLEAAASRTRSVEPLAIPGLTQVPEYMAWVMSARWTPGRDLGREIEARQARQARLVSGALEAVFLVGEPALEAIPARLRSIQLQHLLELSRLPTVTVRIIPAEDLMRITGGHALVILSFDGIGVPDVAYMEHRLASFVIDDPATVAHAEAGYERSLDVAMSRRRSTQRMAEMIAAPA